MKKIVREFQFNAEEARLVEELARSLSLTKTTAGILYARGMDTQEKMRAFLEPSSGHFLSPFLMSGMREAAELIRRARDEEWRVAIYGDYDADGIGASAILFRALKIYGIEAYPFVPERADGYGMSEETIDKIFDEFLPDLVITVDCGISNKNEVEYIKQQGAFVIVTDHHELPDELPDCITVNPKLKDDYPYDNLCGAGVAFKLACALIGEKAYSLLDFAALSTVADSVPLLGENRDIVAEGLKRIRENPRPALAALLGKNTEITAQTLAFTVAPRINAAGRMGDAKAALNMFLSDDEEEISEFAALLNNYNVERQKYCDDLYAQASAQIREEGAYGHIVMLAGENWNAGTVGIVAARIVEAYSRPALLFVKHGDMLRGSARSIENVNIFEALKACSEYIEEFGGHAQAAGVNVKAENFEPLKAALNRYLEERYSREDFIPTVAVCGDAEDFQRVSREIDLLEPFGVGNRRPLFEIKAGATGASPVKPLSPHITLNVNNLELLNFNGEGMLKVLRSDLAKRIVFDYNRSNFRGREYLKGFVRSVVYDSASGSEVELDLFENLVRSPVRELSAEILPRDELNNLIESKIKECAYGLCCVCWERSTLEKYPALQGIEADIFSLSSGGVGNTVLIAPNPDTDLSAYREIVFLDYAPYGVVAGKARVYSCGDIPESLRKLNTEREALLGVYSQLKNCRGTLAGDSYAEIARNVKIDCAKEQIVFALAVFEELGLISTQGGQVRFAQGKKTKLENSAIYSAVRAREV
ncbi:MAG: single-stranded-DNA-specific exonuclease RecJ [Clostridia bacterium]|nr:single-stranded-DNA-specific exonuclease RecJ [Clostridia bacterium]